jgi:cytoskeletal protein CcmA (bactofilin family)
MARDDDSGRSGGRDVSISIVATGMRIVGELATDGVLKVEGTIVGSIRADREVLVARGGVIEGDVYTRQAIVGGRVAGSIYADERVEVQENSMVQGDIVTKRLIVNEGGEVNGNVQMGEPNALEQGAMVAAKRPENPAPPARDPEPVMDSRRQPYA